MTPALLREGRFSLITFLFSLIAFPVITGITIPLAGFWHFGEMS